MVVFLVLLTLALGFADFLSGYEFSFALFYLIPVVVAAWYLGRNPAFALSIFSAVVWGMANWLAGEQFSSPFLPYWNAATRLGFFVVIAVLTARVRVHVSEEEKLARIDPVTGLYNRRAIEERGVIEVLRSRRLGTPLAMVYLDIDDFKAVNDSHGHSAGDDLLRATAQTLTACVRDIDAVARLGGDEFCILFPGLGSDAIHNAVERIQCALLDELATRKVSAGFSFGVVVCLTWAPSYEELLQEADSLMYSAKHDGKNTVRYALYDDRGETILSPRRSETPDRVG